MDNDAIFEAEADIDNVERVNGSDKHRRRLHRGEDAVAAADGAFRTRRTSDDTERDEDTPLLRESEERERRASTVSQDFSGLPWWKRPSMSWMLAPFLIVTIAYGGVIVPRLNLILTLVCRQYIAERESVDPNFSMLPVVFGEQNPQCRIPEVQSRVATFTLYMNLITGILSAITAPKIGALSDRYGRTRLLMLTSCGMFASEIIFIIAATRPEAFPISVILIGSAIDGIAGSFTAMMALANSYASDTTTAQERNVSFGLFHACLFGGIAIGPVLAGYLIKWTDSLASIFWVAFVSHLLFFLFLAFVIPESLSKSRQMRAREHYERKQARNLPSNDWLNQIRSFNFFEPLKILWPTGPGTSSAVRRNLVALAAVDTIMFGVAMGAMTVVVIYTNFEFGWGTLEQSVLVTVVNSCRVSCLVIVLPLLTRLVRGKASTRPAKSAGADALDLGLIRFAILVDILGYVGYSVVRTGGLFILSASIASIGGLGSPTLQSALTKHVPPEKTGQLLGATALLHALARVGGPLVFNAIYAATVGKFTQAVFVCLAGTFGIAFIASLFIRPHVYLEDGEEPEGAATESPADSPSQ